MIKFSEKPFFFPSFCLKFSNPSLTFFFSFLHQCVGGKKTQKLDSQVMKTWKCPKENIGYCHYNPRAFGRFNKWVHRVQFGNTAIWIFHAKKKEKNLVIWMLFLITIYFLETLPYGFYLRQWKKQVGLLCWLK